MRQSVVKSTRKGLSISYTSNTTTLMKKLLKFVENSWKLDPQHWNSTLKWDNVNSERSHWAAQSELCWPNHTSVEGSENDYSGSCLSWQKLRVSKRKCKIYKNLWANHIIYIYIYYLFIYQRYKISLIQEGKFPLDCGLKHTWYVPTWSSWNKRWNFTFSPGKLLLVNSPIFFICWQIVNWTKVCLKY